MTTDIEEGGRKIVVTGNLITLLLNTYGPYAFGAALFLTIWHTTIKPQLELQALDWQAQQEILQTQNELVQNMRELSQILERAATKLGKNDE